MKFFENIKTLLCMSLVLVLMACTAGIRPDTSDKYPFNEKMIEIFGADITIVDSINKSQAQISTLDLSRNYQKLDQVIKVLQKDGWMLKGRGEGVDTYCLDKNNGINIVIPNSKPIIDYQGTILPAGDVSVNSIVFFYISHGVNECE